jgi:hypothetical protein
MSIKTQHSDGPTLAVKTRVGMSLIVAAVLAVAATTGIGAATASAAPAPSTGYSVVSSVTNTNSACLTAVKKAITQGETSVSASVCTTTVTLSATAPQATTVAEIAPLKSSLSASEYQSLAVAAAAGAVQHKSYSQQENNTTDSETQYGTFYYDGSHAWVTVTYRGAQGSHLCRLDWSVGYVIELKGCTEDGTTGTRNLHAHWHFSAIPSGGIVNWDEIYTMHVNSAGTIWQ